VMIPSGEIRITLSRKESSADKATAGLVS